MTTQTKTQLSALLAVLALGGAGMACSAEKIGESLAERAIENACRDDGTSCNVDLSGDGVRIQTEEGTMTVDANGNAVIVGADGKVVNVQSGADGDMTVTEGDGAVVIQQDGDTTMITGDDGAATFTTGSEVPAVFPAAIKLPANATVAGSTVIGDPSSPDGVVMLNLLVPGGLADVAQAVTAGVSAAGYAAVSKTEAPESHYYLYEGNGQSVAAVVTSDTASGGQLVAYTVTSTG